MSPEERATRSRHPAWRWSPDHDGLRRRLAARLAEEGHPWPEMAATLVAVRGRMGTDVSGLAGLVGADPALLAAVERGDASALPHNWVARRRRQPGSRLGAQP